MVAVPVPPGPGPGPGPDDLVRSDEVLEECHVGRRTLGRWFELGKLRRYRIAGDRRVYVLRSELDCLKEPQEVGR